IEDNCLEGGFGGAVLELLADNAINNEVLRIGIVDEFIEHGKVDMLFHYLNMDAESVAERIINRWPGLLRKDNLWGLIRFGQN
ncbi:MAG: 1-deoxy-D-xylulose-5-phosphate synthase, partial [Syntrophomonadaceae bacterium]|nr:1-deoxy-D-xylulose-5-phosphate synthase [Syntrophomonadaceae bacterium]